MVKGILSTNAEAIPDTHTINRIATANLEEYIKNDYYLQLHN